MKIIRTLFILSSIFSCYALAEPSKITPQNTIIISGIDNILIKKTSLLKYLSWSNIDERSLDGWVDRKTFQLLSYGMQKPRLTNYSARIVEYVQKSYLLINDTALIYDYLKKKGYSIVFATNKNRFSYDMINEKLENKLNDLADTIFVSPLIESSHADAIKLQHFAQQPNTPQHYADLVTKFFNPIPTDTILTAPTYNYRPEYYQYIKENIDQEKNVIFIDDTLENINNCASIQTAAHTETSSILFESPLQLTQKLVDMKILSEEEDTVLIEMIKKYHSEREAIAQIIEDFFSKAAMIPSIVEGVRRLIDIYNEEKIFQNLDNADENLTHFIKNQLSETHNVTVKGVKVTSEHVSVMGVSRDYVLVHPNSAQTITKALTNNNQNILDQWRGVLEHEGNHKKHSDVIWSSIVKILSPFITQGSTALLSTITTYVFKQEKQVSYRQQDLEKVFIMQCIIACVKNKITDMIFLAFSRYIEQRADDEISNNIIVLKATKTLFESWQSPHQSFSIKCYDWINNFFEIHPLLTTRIQKLEQRIASLSQNAAS